MFSLKQENDLAIVQSVLITDNGYCGIRDLHSGIEKIKICFPRAKITVLTLTQRQAFLQNEFPDLEFIICSPKLKPRRYSIALQLFFLRDKNFDYLLNFSLDLSPLIVQLFWFNSRIILYNQWGQWCSLRLRRVSQIFTTSYHKQKAKITFKGILKSIGLFFVLLVPDDEQALSHNILVVDDGAVVNQLIYTLRRIKECLPFSRVTLLTVGKRKEIDQELSGVKVIRVDPFLIKRYRIARHMLKLGGGNYDQIILFSLDITPIVIAALFLRGRIFLRNQWHQWWRISLKPVSYYLLLPFRLLVSLIGNILIFIYLGFNVSVIFLLRAFNVFKIKFLEEGN